MLRVCVIVVLLIALPAVAQDAPPDVSALTAERILELDVAAGLGTTGAQISPDGTTFIHVHGTDFCHYSLLGPEIAEAPDADPAAPRSAAPRDDMA